MVLFAALAEVSRDMGATRSRNGKVRRLVEVLGLLAPEEVAPAVGFLVALPIAGPVGLGVSGLHDLRGVTAAEAPSLAVADVEQALEEIRALPPAEIRDRARPLFSRLTREEQRFLVGAMTGSLRQGGLAGVMLRALADASGQSEADVRRAAMVLGSVPKVADVLLGTKRGAALPREVTLFSPVEPMLASSAEDVAEALDEVARRAASAGEASEEREAGEEGARTESSTEVRARVEWKVDGVRAQIHKDGDRVVVYSRQGNDVTRGVKAAIAPLAWTASRVVLDAEIVLLEADGRACPFQETFSVVAAARVPDRGRELRVFAFDCLSHEGEDLLDAPLEERVRRLAASLPEAARMPALDARDAAEAAEFYEASLARGHEGVMVKDLASTYAAGARSPSWFKVKKVTTFDLVVLAVEWGSGRRKGLLSNLHLGARRADGTFCMVGKTFKGLTDAMLREQTEKLLALETHRDEHVVYVRPELVVEIALNDVQRSPRYPGGVALRFARVTRYRPDKRAEEADTLDAVASLGPPPEAQPQKRQLSLFGDE